VQTEAALRAAGDAGIRQARAVQARTRGITKGDAAARLRRGQRRNAAAEIAQVDAVNAEPRTTVCALQTHAKPPLWGLPDARGGARRCHYSVTAAMLRCTADVVNNP